MGLFDTATGYQHKAELRESKDEILVGELIRGLSALGWNPYRLIADSDRQAVGFKVPADPVISAYSLTVDRKSGSGMITQKLGSRTVLGFVAEIHNKVVDPDDLATMWRTDMANLFKVPVAGEVRINHQLNRGRPHTPSGGHRFLRRRHQRQPGRPGRVDPDPVPCAP